MDGRRVTVIGRSAVLTNEELARQGNAALALRSLGVQRSLVWYLPDPLDAGTGGPTLAELRPRWVAWLTWQLVLAAVLAMLWRARRLGRLVPEPLPVVVRAAETEEGRARLYRASRARGRAAATLRTATLRRLARRLAPPPRPPRGVVRMVAEAPAGRPPTSPGCARAVGRRRAGLAGRPAGPLEAAADPAACTRPEPDPDREVRTRDRALPLPGAAAAVAARTRPDGGRRPAGPGPGRPGRADRVRAEVAKAVVGQDAAVTGLVIALLCRGHVLLEGVPGVAKTLLVRSLAAALQLETKRVQFTPDLMPGDVTGSLVYDARTAEFSFREGPVFTNLLLADEINRTPPKTQAALLEAMEERQVSVDGAPRPLPDPFMVAATQNPVEYEGTYPLPEAQLDRFLLKLAMPLPAARGRARDAGPARRRLRPAGPGRAGVRPVAGAGDLAAGVAAVRAVTVSPEVMGYIVDLVRATRSSPSLRSASRRAARPRCWPPAGPGPGCPGATTSPRTTSRRWPGRRCGTGSSCARRPSWRAPP